MTSLLEGRATPDPVVAEHDDTSTIPVAQWGRIAIRLLVAVLLAGAAALAVTAMLPRGLDARTDIVGAPTFNDFDIERYWTTYLVWVVLFPAITLLLYSVLPRAVPALGRTDGPVLVLSRVPAVDAAAPAAGPRALALVGRVGVVGLGVGIELGLRASRTSPSGWGYVVGGTLGYLVAVGFLAVLARGLPSRSLGGPIGARVACSTINLLLSPLLLLGIYAVSRSTSLLVVPTDEVRNFSWIPVWMPLAAVLALLVSDVRHIQRHGLARIGARERRRIVFLAVPVILFLLRSSLPGAVGPPDLFHDGERLTGALLLREGLVPWRDFFLVHGLLYDAFEGAVSFSLIDESLWGLVAGNFLLVQPLCFVTLYLLCALLFERSWLFLTICVVSFVFSPPLAGGLLGTSESRFVLTPLMLGALLFFLRRTTWPRALVLTALLVGSAVVTPESAYYLAIVPPVVIAYDLRGWHRGRPLWSRLHRTRLFAVSGVLWSAVVVVVLAAVGALGGFIEFLRIFGSDHELTGGVAATWGGFAFAVSAYIVPVAIVVSIGYVVWRVRSRRPLSPEDWVALAAAAFAATYYRKFLSRSDGTHVVQSYTVTLPLLLYIAYRSTELLDRFVTGHVFGGRRPLVAPQTVILLVLVPVLAFPWRPGMEAIGERLELLPQRVQPSSSVPYLDPRLGYSIPSPNTTDDIHDLSIILDEVLPGARVYDFSNQPALFNFLLGKEVVSRYTNVSQAIRQQSQEEVIKDLDEVRPEVIAWIGDGGMPFWDYIYNTVRHYDISEHILRTYRPWLQIDGQILMLRHDLPTPDLPTDRLAGTPVTSGLLFSGYACDWGFAPNFLATLPTDDGIALPARPVSAMVDVSGWAVDGGSPVEAIVVTLDGETAMTLPPNVTRPDVAATFGIDPTEAIGFSARVPDASVSGTAVLAAYAIMADGTAQVLPGGAPGASTVSVGGRTVPVVQGPSTGNLDTVQVLPAEGGRVRPNPDPRAGGAFVTRIDLPADAARASWLILEDQNGLALDSYDLTDRFAIPGRSITFATREGSTRIGVQVGACPQWHGWQSTVVYVQQAGVRAAQWRLVTDPVGG